MLRTMGFTCSPTKCVPFTDSKNPIVVTGYVINQEKIAPPQAYRHRVRNLVRGLIKTQADAAPIELTDLAVVRGHLADLRETCPEELNSDEADLMKSGFPTTSDLLPVFFLV